MKEYTVPESMRNPRKAKRLAGTERGWWYVEPNGISVFAQSNTGASTAVMLTLSQLRRAIEIIEWER